MMEAASWFHCSVKPVSRSAGRSVVAAAAYRIGERLEDHEYGVLRDYTRRSGVAAAFTVAPAHAPWASDPERLWNAAEAAENRRNSQLARECELALPASLSATEREAIVRSLVQDLVDRYGVAVTAAIHLPSRHGDDRNHHAHVLMTTREVTADGLGKKTRILDAKQTGPGEVRWMRAHAADLINAALEKAGLDERVDHRSFQDRGIAREPTTHLGPTASAMERKGRGSERGDANRETEARNHQLDALVQDLAALDAEIAAEQERALDARFGPATPEPSATVGEGRASADPSPDPAAHDPSPATAEKAPGGHVVVPSGGNALTRALRRFFRDATPELFELPATPSVPESPPPVTRASKAVPQTVYDAEWLVRDAASQFPIQDLAFGAADGDRTSASSISHTQLPRFEAPADQTSAGEQVRAVAALFVEAIARVGTLSSTLVDLVDDGLQWFHHVAHYLAELVEDVRDTLRGPAHDPTPTWRDYVRREREERNRDDELDFD